MSGSETACCKLELRPKPEKEEANVHSFCATSQQKNPKP